MLICAACGREKYEYHTEEPPHGSISGGACQGYMPGRPCLNCSLDLEQHEIAAPHPRIIGAQIVCAAAQWPGGQDEPPFEGGGGSSGGGGASGSW